MKNLSQADLFSLFGSDPKTLVRSNDPDTMHVKRSVTVEVLFTRLALVTASGQVHDLPRFE